MKPFRILIFFLAVFALLFGASYLVPKDGIRLKGNVSLKFINPAEIFNKDTVQYVDISGLVNPAALSPDPETFRYNEIPVLQVKPETVKPETAGQKPIKTILPGHGPSLSASAKRKVIQGANIDSLRKSIQPLELSGEGKQLLFSFFENIDGVKVGEKDRIRILHYGDSQIESDRMTSLIRFRLQEYFGGYGCGLVSAIPLYAGNPAFTEKSYGDFRRFTIFGKRDTVLNHNSYGVLGCFTSLPQSRENKLPSIEYNFNKNKRAGRFDRIKLYLHSYSDSASIIFGINGTSFDTLDFISGGFSIINYRPDTIVNRLNIQFDFLQGGRIYGISFESEQGIQMDNIAMRGSSGLVFSKMDKEVLQDMMTDLGVGLLIMQFGGNIVPYIRDSNYYKRTFIREISYLKEICQDVPIIVIGPSDMSTRENGYFVTHPSVEPVRNALKEAARESGIIFWDLYEAMGGYNSMPSFVNTDPPLARPDYIHFSFRGANFMAEMFYNALMLEYNAYKSESNRQYAIGSMVSPVSSGQPGSNSGNDYSDSLGIGLFMDQSRTNMQAVEERQVNISNPLKAEK